MNERSHILLDNLVKVVANHSIVIAMVCVIAVVIVVIIRGFPKNKHKP